MAKYIVDIEPEARLELKKHYMSGNQASIKKITKILLELTETPFAGVGKPEALKYELSGKWSREINQKDRMIYTVNEQIVTVVIISAMGHYNDK